MGKFGGRDTQDGSNEVWGGPQEDKKTNPSRRGKGEGYNVKKTGKGYNCQEIIILAFNIRGHKLMKAIEGRNAETQEVGKRKTTSR